MKKNWTRGQKLTETQVSIAQYLVTVSTTKDRHRVTVRIGFPGSGAATDNLGALFHSWGGSMESLPF